jgi:uncharacterized protein YyaL (SSP411 family)
VPNRLARERSPYLLQHAGNPVDWYAWGAEAFEAARREDKPIFLSIGYSTCHWCHVMAHESFEDAAIGLQLNRDFVSIKLDREERPDVDRVYMAFVQATTGAGGWPMSVWLTPDLKPFFGGTYFPPTSRWGRPGFTDVLSEIARAWRGERPRILESAETIVGRLRQATGGDAAPDRAPVAGRNAIETGIAEFTKSFDARRGGFGGAPKFPRPSELLFLLEGGTLLGDRHARQMALDTLRAMAMGGMRDHVGGGFHRYSVDAEWRVPHFEKMLYDQAQLVLAYLEGAQASGEAFYATVAEDTLDYVLRDLTAPDGAFFSAEDADSAVLDPEPVSQPHAEARRGGGENHAIEKREGAFYVWKATAIDALFGAEAPIVRRRFGIEDGGNAPADPQDEFRGQNLLYIAQSIEDLAVRVGRSADDVVAMLAKARRVLFDARGHRPRPHLDDKVITAWNGLMIAAYARAARVLVESPRRDEWLRAATRAATAVRTHLWRSAERRLLRRYRDGEAAVEGFCEDYAYLVWGLVELFQAGGDVQWLDWANELTAIEISLFSDDRDGGWFSTTGSDPSVLLRLKEDYDGAEPAAASVTVRNLLALGHLSSGSTLTDRAGRTLERYGSGLGRVARVMPLMLANAVLWNAPALQVVIVGTRGAADTRALEAVVAAKLLPWAVQVPVSPGEPQQALSHSLPWLGAMTPRDGRATAYVCQSFACQAPVTDPAALERQLDDAGTPRVII